MYRKYNRLLLYGTVGNFFRLRDRVLGVELRGLFFCLYLKKNQNASRPSEHPPVRGGKMSKRLGGIKGCEYKTSSWQLNGFPDGNDIGSTV